MTTIHMISIFRLTESIEYTSPIRIGMITALMIERMPLCSTDKLTGSTVHLIITFSQRQRLYEQRTFPPTAARTVIVVVSVPIVYILSEFTGENTLLRPISLFVISRPTVNYVIMFFHTGGMHIGSSYGTSRIRKFFFGYFECFQGKVERIAGFIQNRFPHQNRWVITVTANHFAGVLMNQFSEFHILVPILPSRSSYDNKHTEFIASIHKSRILWIVCYPDNCATGIPQAFCIPPLLRIRQGIAYVCKVLMAVGTY